MANQGNTEHSLVARLIDPSPESQSESTCHSHGGSGSGSGPSGRKDVVFKKRRLRRSRSATLPDYPPYAGKNNNNNNNNKVMDLDSVPVPSIFGEQVHPSLVKVATLLLVYFGLGAVCFYIMGPELEGEKTNRIVDALYLCVVTMTTVGYGDLVPEGVVAKLLACGFVFTGMALVGLILGKAADYLAEKQEGLVVRALEMQGNSGGDGEVASEMGTANRVKHKLILSVALLFVLVVIGSVVLVVMEKRTVVNAVYCVCCTITTLGYGDQSFSTLWGRVFAIFWILTSTICLAQVFLYIAELNTESRQQALAKFVLNRRVTHQDLEAADLDSDGVVTAAEFILYKMKEMGKISEEDVLMVMKEFEEVDVDESGSLSLSDIRVAQSDPQTSTHH